MGALLLVIFVCGAALGSFINVVALRYGTTRNWAWERSACPNCSQQLRWWELVPVVSYIALRGRCVRCRTSIHLRYLLVELLCGTLTVLAFLPLPLTVEDIVQRVLLTAILTVLMLLALIDLKTFLLPDRYVLLLTALAALLLAMQPTTWRLDMLWGALAGSGFLFALWLVTRGQGIGLGDVKLMVPLGALIGLPGVVVLFFIAFCVGGLTGLLLLAQGRATMKTALPFGPFLVGAAILVLLMPQLPEQFLSFLFLV